MNNSMLSVLLPVYNGEPFLAEAIESILRQSFKNFEFIIINDGSQDSSGEIIDYYAANDSRIRAFHQDNQGLVATLNRGVELARSPFIARMDADDVSLPQRFELQLPQLIAQPRLAVVGGFINIVDEEGRFLKHAAYPVGKDDVARFLEADSPFAHPTVIMRRSVVEGIGGYRSAYRCAQDYDLWLRIYDAGYDLENVPETILNYRQHAGSISLRNGCQQLLAARAARLAHRARQNDMPDPTDQAVHITKSTISDFPAELRGDVDAELFALQHNMGAFPAIDELYRALDGYRMLSKYARRDARLVHFHRWAARGFYLHGKYTAAIREVLYAAWRDPLVIARILQLACGVRRR